jgi:class 3 adenylate cyclase
LRFDTGHQRSEPAAAPAGGRLAGRRAAKFSGVAPVARYAKSGDLNIAYIVEGGGDVDLVWIPPWVSQVEYLWSEPALERVMERLTRFARVITFDRRGSGLSDPLWGAPTLEDQMDDVLAVMDAAGSERAAIAGTLEGGPMAALFAATFPERTTHLVLYATFARATWAPDYEWAWRAEERDRHMDELVARWGEGLLAGGVAIRQMSDPSFMEWAGRLERLAASPATIRRIFDLIGAIDVREVLPSIRVPALVLHRSGDEVIKIEHSRYIASHIPGARFVELEGDENIFAIGDTEAIMGEIEEFITGERLEREPDRMLATVLFTDIVESTRRAAELGDRSWRFLLERHDALFRQALERHRGREVKRTGDGFLATFDGPARAIRCAASVAEAMGSLGIEVRAGLHTGELEVMDGDLGGLAVHIASRVMTCADAGEVLVSGTVKDLVVGSGIEFEDRGERELRGIPGEWRLFAVR